MSKNGIQNTIFRKYNYYTYHLNTNRVAAKNKLLKNTHHLPQNL